EDVSSVRPATRMYVRCCSGRFFPTNRNPEMSGSTEPKRYRWSGRTIDVPFLFGALGASAVTGPVLVRLLSELGVHESAARNLLVRMRNMGFLEVERSGRMAIYRINAEFTHRYRQVEGTAAAPIWQGRFDGIVYSIPEKFRRLRDRLHHTALAAGYGQLRSG